MAHIVQLMSYPIKGCAGVPVSQAVLLPAGLRHDRSFMVVAEDGTFRSQRQDFRLALIRPELDPEGLRITLRANGFAGLGPVDVDVEGARRPVILFGSPFTGIDQGDEIAGWLTEFLGMPSRLVRVPPEHGRVTTGATPGTAGYADSSAVLLLSQSSLELLNTAIAEGGGSAVPISRFRPNIVVSGWRDAHVEDTVMEAELGDAQLRFAKEAIRCSVTLVDQATGRRAGPEPLRTLAQYRRRPGGVAFGAKFAVTRPGAIAVGDEVKVGEWAS